MLTLLFSYALLLIGHTFCQKSSPDDAEAGSIPALSPQTGQLQHIFSGCSLAVAEWQIRESLRPEPGWERRRGPDRGGGNAGGGGGVEACHFGRYLRGRVGGDAVEEKVAGRIRNMRTQ